MTGSATPALAYYVSSHGFGHAVRSAQMLRALRILLPEYRFYACTGAPTWLLPDDVQVRPVTLDVGVVQADALRLDPLATLTRAAELLRAEAGDSAREAAWLREIEARIVVADIPSTPFLAATRAGLPSVGISNFSWDWFYRSYAEEHPEYCWVVERLRRAYGHATLLLRLPYAGDLSAFPAVEDIPLIARTPSRPPADVKRELGLTDEKRPIVLFSFGGLGLAGLSGNRLGQLDRYRFLVQSSELSADATPENVTRLERVQHGYENLVAASDLVVTKPGYGITADCLAARRPVLYTDRGDFAEYPVLSAGMERDGRAVYIPQEELWAGDIEPYLERALALDKPWRDLRLDGAEVAARRIAQLARTRSAR
jgi:L-arabinokinase